MDTWPLGILHMRGALFLTFLLFCQGACALTCLNDFYKLYMETNVAFRDFDKLQAFLQYKNTPREIPETVDLARKCLQDVCAELEVGVDKRWANRGAPSLYEKEVLRLKVGDTVVFGEKQFRLGEFLGMGNTTHIYRLADDPEWAVRITLASMVAIPQVNAEDSSQSAKQRARFENHLHWGKRWIEDAEGQENVVPVRESDPTGRYHIVRYVPNGQTGESYLKELGFPHGTDGGKSLGAFPLWSDVKFSELMRALSIHKETTVEDLQRKSFFEAGRHMWGDIGDGFRWYNIDPE